MGTVSVVAKRLKQAREQAGLSQKQLGIRAGIDEFSASPRVNQYERGKHMPDYSMVERLAGVLKVPAPFFYTRDEDLAQLIMRFGSLSAAARRRLARRMI